MAKEASAVGQAKRGLLSQIGGSKICEVKKSAAKGTFKKLYPLGYELVTSKREAEAEKIPPSRVTQGS